jgi:hypothetical protein
MPRAPGESSRTAVAAIEGWRDGSAAAAAAGLGERAWRRLPMAPQGGVMVQRRSMAKVAGQALSVRNRTRKGPRHATRASFSPVASCQRRSQPRREASESPNHPPRPRPRRSSSSSSYRLKRPRSSRMLIAALLCVGPCRGGADDEPSRCSSPSPPWHSTAAHTLTTRCRQAEFQPNRVGLRSASEGWKTFQPLVFSLCPEAV